MSTNAAIEDEDPVTGEPVRRSRAGRRVSKGLLWLLVLAWLGFAGWRLFGPEVNWVVVVAMTYTPYVMFAGLVLVLWALLLRAGVAFTGALLSIMALVAVVVPRMIGLEPPTAEGSELTVMTVNLRVGGGDAAEVMSLAEQQNVDVLSLQEITDESLVALDDAGLTSRFPHQEYVASTDASGTGVFSSVPVTALDPVPGRFFMPTVRLDLPDEEDVHLTAVHPAAPTGPSAMAAWRTDLESLPPADRDGPINILAGDFNATLDHAALRGLIDTGYVDAADATGNGLTGTWQPLGALSGIAPPVALDRVLVDDRVAVRDLTVHYIEDTDHRAVIATVQLP